MGLSLGENEFILLKNWLSENRWRFYLRLQRLQLSQLGGLVFECYISCSVSVISSTHKVCNRPPFFYNSTKQLRWYPIWYFTVDVNRKIKANTFQISPTITQYQELAVGLKQIKERGIFWMNKNKSVCIAFIYIPVYVDTGIALRRKINGNL